jgi:hypothetical protein
MYARRTQTYIGDLTRESPVFDIVNHLTPFRCEVVGGRGVEGGGALSPSPQRGEGLSAI